ncbi:hypothetical protein, partial [Haloferula sp. A504]|uniref:hypothetical protein n=1 Tax=Haloferula sp. A504 TaxID=3373601 RepID=UPI0031CB5E51|nr:hypothetical protein [Verrucomicrobiaceae bacterium E54]
MNRESGYRIVKACLEAEVELEVLPGPCAQGQNHLPPQRRPEGVGAKSTLRVAGFGIRFPGKHFALWADLGVAR